VLGLALGTLLGLSRRAARLASLSIEVLRPVPSVALIPLAMLVFGFGLRMEVSVVAFATCGRCWCSRKRRCCRWSRACWRWHRRYSSRPWQRFVWIVCPAIVPRLFVALRLGVAIALVVAVTVEIAANPTAWATR
jgi:sulfonate transport system permease protein